MGGFSPFRDALVALALLVLLGALPGALGGWWAASQVLWALVVTAFTLPNLLVHLVRRLTVHYAGHERVIWLHFYTGADGLRDALARAFADVLVGSSSSHGGGGAGIEGLESPRGSGVVYPIALLASSLVAPPSSDCTLALLRPAYGGSVCFQWQDLQANADAAPGRQSSEQAAANLRRCVAANGYCLVRLPRLLAEQTHTALLSEGAAFFRGTAEAKARCRHAEVVRGGGGGVGGGDLRHGWFAEAGFREYYEVHRQLTALEPSQLAAAPPAAAAAAAAAAALPYPSAAFGAAAEGTFATCEAVALRVLQLLLEAGDGSTASAAPEAGLIEPVGAQAAAGSGAEDESDEEAGLLLDDGEEQGGGWMSLRAIQDSLRDRHCTAQGGLSTSCVRLHQYNPGKARKVSGTVHRPAQLTKRDCPAPTDEGYPGPCWARPSCCRQRSAHCTVWRGRRAPRSGAWPGSSGGCPALTCMPTWAS
jgi:hypothetical protein